MLKISKPLGAAHTKTYFTESYSAPSESYYTQGSTVIGQWHGQLAEHFGLRGGVTREAFDRLADGQDPNTGEQLIKHRTHADASTVGQFKEHVSSWDWTIAPHKSVSVTALVGGDDRLLNALRESAKTAFDAGEKYTQARLRDTVPVTTANWAAALFEHTTSRPVDGVPDPQWHMHGVVFNMTQAGDKIRSLSTREWFRIQSYISAVFHSELAVHMKALGYEVEQGKNFSCAIKGYTEDYLQACSRRTAQIEKIASERGMQGAEADEIIAHQSKETKIDIDPAALKALHQAEAAKYGNQPVHVVEAAKVYRRSNEISPESRAILADQAITFAKHKLGYSEAVFDHYEVMREALRYGQGSLRLADVESAFEQRRAQHEHEFIEVGHYRANAPGARYTTADMLTMERESIEFIRRGIGCSDPIAQGLRKDDFRAEHKASLNDGQKHVVWNVVTSKDRVVGVHGTAGAGKTWALRALREIVQHHGYEVHGLAPTSPASKELAAAGITIETLQMFLLRGAADPSRSRVYFLDESSLASTNQVHHFLHQLRPDDRVVLVGDTRQHQSVEAGRIFEELQQSGMRTFNLNTIMRQRDSPQLLAVVKSFAVGNVHDGLEKLTEQERVHEFQTRKYRFQAIARDYAKTPQATLVISPDNKSRQELNTAIRAELKTEGVLEDDKLSARILISRQNLTYEDRRQAFSYEPGEIVRFAKTNKTIGAMRGEYVTVTACDRKANLLTVARANGEEFSYNPRNAAAVQVFTAEERSLAVGDRLQFTQPWKTRRIANRDLATILKLDLHGNIKAKLDDGRTVKWHLAHMPHVDYGYAVTSYSSQGQTVDRVLLQIDTQDSRVRGLIDKTLAYVALSRPRYDAQIYTDSKERLEQSLSRQHVKPKALSKEQIQEYRQDRQHGYAVA